MTIVCAKIMQTKFAFENYEYNLEYNPMLFYRLLHTQEFHIERKGNVNSFVHNHLYNNLPIAKAISFSQKRTNFILKFLAISLKESLLSNSMPRYLQLAMRCKQMQSI